MKLNREKIDLVMAEKKISQGDIADFLDVSSSTVYKYLKNYDRVRVKTIGRLADALQVEIEEIVD